MVHLFYIVLHEFRGRLTGKRYMDEVLHPQVLPSIGLVEKIFSSSKTNPHTFNMARNCMQASHGIPP